MTAPLHNPPRSSALPASQTAPVAEFRCLFSTDVVRKHKRWRDGFLKFHSFNNRVMLYDSNRCFQGDTYWKESHGLDEGEELVLDKGYPVQVADRIGVTQTDLTPLFEKNRKEPEQEQSTPGKPAPRPTPKPAGAVPRAASQLRHKSLNALLGTPKGPIGKALPVKSPYEQRKEKENEWAADRAAKRQKVTHVAASSSPIRPAPPAAPKPAEPVSRVLDTGALLAAPTPIQPAPRVASAAPRAHNTRPAFTAPRPVQDPAPVITIESTSDDISSHLSFLGQSSPARRQPAATSAKAPVPVTEAVFPKPTPALKAPRLPKGSIPLPHQKSLQTPQPPPRSLSPPVSASNKLSNVNFALEAARKPMKEPSPPKSPPRDPKAKSLRLATGVKRRMLVCQELSAPQKRAPKEPSPPQPKALREMHAAPKPKLKKPTEPARKKAAPKAPQPEPLQWQSDDEAFEMPAEPPLLPPSKPRPDKTVETTRNKPAAKIPEPELIDWPSDDEGFQVLDEPLDYEIRPIISKRRRVEPQTMQQNTTENAPSSSPAFEDIDAIHGLLDQQMVPKPFLQRKQQPQPKSPSPPVPPARKRKAAVPKKSAAAKMATEEQSPSKPPSPPAEATEQPMTKTKPKRTTTTRKKPAKVQPALQEASPGKWTHASPEKSTTILIPDSPASVNSLPMSPDFQRPPLAQQSRESSAALSCVSASVSPKKPLSTGGFRRRARRTAIAESIEKIASGPMNRAPILPPPPTPAVVREGRKKHAAEVPAEEKRDEEGAREKAVPEKALQRTGGVSESKKKRRIIIEGPGGIDIPIGEDEIEDDVIEPGYLSRNSKTIATNSSFRRVKSANAALDKDDPPVLSMSGEWERRNLPSTRSNTHSGEKQRGELNHDGALPGPPPGTAFPDPTQGTLSLLTTVAENENVFANPASASAKGNGKGAARFKGGLAALISRTDPRKKFLARSASLNVDTSGSGRRGSIGDDDGKKLGEGLPSPVVDTDVGPWSSEAFDLFDWRPPGMEGR